MTEKEICRNYLEAKDRSEQIIILADLNCTSRKVIKQILLMNDVLDDRDKRLRKKERNNTYESDLIENEYKQIKAYSKRSDLELDVLFRACAEKMTTILQAMESKKISRNADDYTTQGRAKMLFPVESHYIYFDKKDDYDAKLFLEEFAKMCHARKKD